MKLSAIFLGVFFTLMSINTASAGGGHHHHRNKHHYRQHNVHHYNYRHHNSHRVIRHYDYGHHDTHKVVHHYKHRGSNVAYALGGVVVGSVIGAILTQSNNRGAQHYGNNQPVYANPYRR